VPSHVRRHSPPAQLHVHKCMRTCRMRMCATCMRHQSSVKRRCLAAVCCCLPPSSASTASICLTDWQSISQSPALSIAISQSPPSGGPRHWPSGGPRHWPSGGPRRSISQSIALHQRAHQSVSQSSSSSSGGASGMPGGAAGVGRRTRGAAGVGRSRSASPIASSPSWP